MPNPDIKIPQPAVLQSLFRKFAENKEKVGSINGELGDRLRNQYEMNQHFTPFFWSNYARILWTGQHNELKAREMIDQLKAVAECAEVELDSWGHQGDLVKQAEAKTKEEPARAPEADNVTPLAEVREEKRRTTRKAKKVPEPGGAVETLRSTVEEGDAHIKSLLKKDDEELKATKRSILEGAETKGNFQLG